jgi:hypothetical protein
MLRGWFLDQPRGMMGVVEGSKDMGDPTDGPRGIAKQQYANVRRSLADFEERVVARYWDEDTLARTSFDRFLGSLDKVAGWLLADDELSGRGQARPRQTGDQQEQDQIAAEPDTEQPAMLTVTGPVNVTFTLPAEVQADSVVLCGEFNQWAPEGIELERGADGTWQATVALEPGRSYRYRYLLDGERWENARQADRYVPNPYGSVDSVIIVSPAPEN